MQWQMTKNRDEYYYIKQLLVSKMKLKNNF